MRKNIFKIILAIYSLFYIQYTWSDVSVAQIEKERKNIRTSFERYANQINNCSEKLNNLSLEARDIQKITSERTIACQSPVSTREQYQQCLNLTNNILSRTRSLERSISDTRSLCPFFSSADSLKKKLEASIHGIKSSLNNIDETGLGHSVALYQKIEQDGYDRWKPISCVLDLPGSLDTYTTASAYRKGDIYALHKSLSQLKIVKDYVSTIYTVCSADDPLFSNTNNEVRDTMNKLRMSSALIDMEKMVQEVTNMVDDALVRFDNPDFDVLSGKICEHLQSKNKNDWGLCENPIDTPEWAYSIHYRLTSKEE